MFICSSYRSRAKASLVLLSEFSSHSDLHMAEGMAFEDAENLDQNAETIISSRGQPTYTNESSVPPEWPSAAESLSPRSLTAVPRSSNTNHEYAHGVMEWANVLFSSTPPTPRAKTAKIKNKNARRLGVCATTSSTALAFLR